jgi:hypothetical protein
MLDVDADKQVSILPCLATGFGPFHNRTMFAYMRHRLDPTSKCAQMAAMADVNFRSSSIRSPSYRHDSPASFLRLFFESYIAQGVRDNAGTPGFPSMRNFLHDANDNGVQLVFG